MKVDITELLIFFDELMPPTDEEQKVYWFKTKRKDKITIIFIVSVYEESVAVLIETENGVNISSIDMENCSEIRILDQKRKCLEVLHEKGNGRCFLSLLEDSILSYTESEREKSRAS
jgi:hypothetical protein